MICSVSWLQNETYGVILKLSVNLIGGDFMSTAVKISDVESEGHILNNKYSRKVLRNSVILICYGFVKFNI